MENSLLTRVFPLAFVFMLGNVSAEDNVIYRWVDKNNVVHFTQHQPDHDNYTTIKMANSGNRSSSPAEALPKANENTTAKVPNKAEEKSTIESTMEKRCQEAKTNVRTLNAFESVQFIDAEGNAKVLTEKEKNEQLKLSEKQVEVYCKK